MALLSPIGAVPTIDPSTLTSNTVIGRTDRSSAAGLASVSPGPSALAPSGGGVGQMFETVFSSIETKQQQAQAVTSQVLMGDNDQLHQSVIAMQEASVAFSLMVEVRNKLVDSYQELMRMPA